MNFTETGLPGAFLVDLERKEDDRGFFARSFCSEEFSGMGLVSEFVQNNVSFNKRAGTLRGLHFQVEPYPECKLVRCTMGRIFDVIVDIRPQSSSFGQWFGVELSADNRTALYIPVGFAHGFVTLVDSCEVFYHMSAVFHPECARSVNWQDPAIGIDWPVSPVVVSGKDAAAPTLQTIVGK